ncbi:MAG: TerB family tellurite resistance protein [Gammaproteobacteria bacterium]|nr:MAG: TerB family tellurite resistance protein [Gammaproteobacteria bacterium]
MDNQDQHNWFEDIETIVSEPLNFKSKLAIGEDAYTSLKLKNAVFETWEVAGVATTAVVVAKSSAIATTFFAPTGWLAAIGIGTAATPVGWVIAAGVVTGGAWVGITRYLKKASANRLTVIPKFINTPLDVLALGLFDLLAPLALKVASVEGHIEDAGRNHIRDYFVNEWGYDPRFVGEGIKYIESNLDSFSIRALSQTLAKFASENPDCNFKVMSAEILGFLRNMAATDGRIDERIEMEIERIEAIFKSVYKFSLKKNMQKGWGSIRQAVRKFFTRSNSTKNN